MDLRRYNREAWDRQVESGNEWTVPVGPEIIEAARRDEWAVLLTETRSVPRAWFPEMAGADILCLASGGGQQAPIFAAAGANVTVLDNSPKQLAQDRFVAERESLDLKTVEGDMRDLSAFAEESFDLVFHPVSNLFVSAVGPVWAEAFRVLREGGSLLAGFLNPVVYVFDRELLDRTGEVRVESALLRCDEPERRRGEAPVREGRATRVQPHPGGAGRGSDTGGVPDLWLLRRPPSGRPYCRPHAYLRRHQGDQAIAGGSRGQTGNDAATR
jgi:SAM-dependent methyltransferase